MVRPRQCDTRLHKGKSFGSPETKREGIANFGEIRPEILTILFIGTKGLQFEACCYSQVIYLLNK